jgi:hypothetical protein
MKTSKIISLAAAFGLSVLSTAAFAIPVTTPVEADQAAVTSAYNNAVAVCAAVGTGDVTEDDCALALQAYIDAAVAAGAGGPALVASLGDIADDIGAAGAVADLIEDAQAVAEETASVVTDGTTEETEFGGSDGPSIVDEDFGGGDGGEPVSEN